MDLCVVMARFTHTSIEYFLKLPLNRLRAWTNSINRVAKMEQDQMERANGKRH